MKEQELKDDFLKSTLQRAARNMPNQSFEHEMMLKIEAEVEYKQEVAAQLRKSLHYFLAAVFTSVVLLLFILLGNLESLFSGRTIVVLVLLFIGVSSILNVDNYRRLIRKYSS